MTRIPGLTARRLLPALLLGLAVLVTAGCGCCDDEYVVTSGNVYVDNLTDTTEPEYCLGFYLAPTGGTWTGNLLLQELPPATTQFVGSFTEDYYDAEADMDFGDLVAWDAIPVPAADDTYFEIY